jgi:short-subunit dehydrogenase
MEPRPFAVITGASRGIGAAYARALARQGYDLLLVARDKARLEALSGELSRLGGGTVFIEALDLAQADAAQRLFVAARQRRPVADMLINNAGFGIFGRFVETPLPRLQDMLRVHVNSIVESIRLFLPGMCERRSGAVITVSSVAGWFAMPYLAEYAATKAFLISFSESLAEEVRDADVRIQVCCPATTDTDFHRTAGFKPANPLGGQTADQVVAASLAALKRGAVVVPSGWQARLIWWVSRVVPRRLLVRQTARRMKPRG